ncbi:MAG TPA: carboxypeptidase regulatory-like domain-containing protein [Bryobacteraceae bacterium]|nr:carboxypeptidase regulatory-like domain-containing protein [Bryobacteraceae bacterium]
MKIWKLFKHVFLLGAPLLWAFSAAAQIHGDIAGTLLDSTNAPVQAGHITLTSSETGERRTQTTDVDGRFGFHQLKIGEYKLTANATGFRQAVTTATVRSGDISAVTIKLEVGSLNESVTVSDAASVLDAASSQMQVSLDRRQIMKLPVLRNPLAFALTSPGVTPVTPNNPFFSTSNYNANGGRGRANNITIDNITSTDIVTTGNGGSQTGPLNYEQIQEVTLISGDFSAEFGRNSSSQLQIITQPGTNEFHGSAYEFMRNDKLDARDFFDTTGKATVARINEYGAAVGGPIRKNKTQFFATFAENPVRGAGTVRIAQVPTPDMIAAVTDPTSKQLLSLYTLPTSPTGQIQQSASNLQNAHQFSIRIDHQLTDHDTLTGRYGHFYQEGTGDGDTFLGSNIGGFGANFVNGPRNFNLTETHLFSTTVVNEARFAFGRVSPAFAAQFTTPGPRISINDGEVNNFGESEVIPQLRVENTFQYGDSVTWMKGAHNVKAGADVYRYQVNTQADTISRGFYRFATWADFAAGNPASYSQRFGSTVRGFRVTNQAYYLQDDWRIKRNLTLNIGMRAEVAGGANEVNGLISNLDLNCTSPIGSAGTGPLGCFSIGQPSNESHINWAPRFGFAWNPGSDQKTVVRGGYGISYDFLYLNPVVNQLTLPPFIYTASLSGSAFTGVNSWSNLVAGKAQVQADAAVSSGQVNPTAKNFGNANPILDPALRNPQTQQWSIGIERQTIDGIVVKASYVGSKSNYLQRTRPINLINVPSIAPATSVADETANFAAYMSATGHANGNASTPSDRFDPRFNDVNLIDSSANSNYHSFQFVAQKAFSHGYWLQVAYTFSKSIDDVSDAMGVLINDSSNQQNPLNNRDNRAVSEFDVPQNLVITHVWDLPFGKHMNPGLLRTIASGWSFAGISSYRSGFPVTFDAGPRRGIQPIALTGVTGGVMRVNAAGPFSFNPLPAGSAGALTGMNNDPVQPIALYAASLGLSQPLLGNYGTLGRNVNRLNAAPSFDWSVLKTTRVTEKASLELRAEFYNVFNHPVFQDVNRTITSPTFGQYTDTAWDSRNVQVAARLVF